MELSPEWAAVVVAAIVGVLSVSVAFVTTRQQLRHASTLAENAVKRDLYSEYLGFSEAIWMDVYMRTRLAEGIRGLPWGEMVMETGVTFSPEQQTAMQNVAASAATARPIVSVAREPETLNRLTTLGRDSS